MSILAATVATLVLSTSDICDDPLQGGRGEPFFCVITEAQFIRTPYLSLEIHPHVLVGVDRKGARIFMQDNVPQNMIGLEIQAFPLDELSDKLREFGTCGNLVTRKNGVLICDRSSEGVFWKEFFFTGHSNIVVAILSSGSVAFELLPQYLSMIESISINET